ncbi:MAG: PAS domain S-box protein [Bacteroidales bacterium]|nr:PAS domain S-box protein [Bacteroidales bacterium]
MISKRQKPVVPWLLIVLFVILSASSIILGFLYYKSQKNRLLRDKTLELSAIADLKVRQIAQWRNERADDARMIGENVPFVRLFYDYMSGTGIKVNKAEIIASLKSVITNTEYKNILLIDSTGKVRGFYPNQDTVLGNHMLNMFPEFIKLKKGILTDLHKTPGVSYNHLDLVIPLLTMWNKDPETFGLIIIRIDPQETFYSLIQTWPVPSKTAESLLVRQEGDKVLFLNELRFRKNSEMELVKSVSEEKLPAAMAVRGIETTSDGRDYRGKAVVAAMKKVPGSTWFMVAKTDQNEIFEALNRQITLIIVIIILFILTIGLLLGIIEWSENVRFYREKYEAELDQQALRKHYDYILKYANDIIFLTDRNMVIVEANDRATETYQRNRDELIGMNLKEITAPGAVREIAEESRILDDIGFATYETLHVRKDGTVLPVEISARKVEIEGIKYYQSICRDITERKFAEETLRESEIRFRKIFEESPISIVMTGKDMGIIRVNSAFTRMTGYGEDELKSRSLRDITHPDYVPQDDVSLLRLVAEEIPVYHTENKYFRKDGSLIWGSTTISLIRNNNDEVQYFLAMIEDITLRKNSEAELIAAKEKAEESDRLKTAFLHNVSHEIRTPMNAIIGFSALLNEPDITEADRRQFIDIIFQSGSQLLSIINDIVDIANIESGQVKVNIREMNLNFSLRSLDEQFSYKEKSDVISINLKTGLPDNKAMIMTDSTKLIQILSNLINNATKFTKEGRIDFGYTLKGDELEFYVKDTGIGIPPEHHDKIFERFFQVDNLISRKFGGTGLGLSICKAYVEILGGRIWLISQPGEGSDFRFTIPYKPAGSKI